MIKKGEPFYQIKKWKKILEVQLYLLVIVVILLLIALLSEKNGGISNMWRDIWINVGCSIVCSIVSTIAVTLILYFNFLKRIPTETKKAIDDLLTARLGHETTNHNALRDALTPDNRSLSSEHSQIRNDVKENFNSARSDAEKQSNLLKAAVVDTDKNVAGLRQMIKQEQFERKVKQENLTINQLDVTTTIEKITALNEQMINLNTQNRTLANENEKLRAEIDLQKSTYSILSKQYNELVTCLTPHKAVGRDRDKETQKSTKNKTQDYDMER